MKASMPYGEIIINTREEAANFLMHACDNCNQNNLMNECSGAQANKCNEQKEAVLKHFTTE